MEIVYVDDLNGFKEFEHNASVDSIMAEAKKCQTRAAQPGHVRPREGVHTHRVPTAQPHRDSFKLLAVHFDCNPRMDVSEVVSQASWMLTGGSMTSLSWCASVQIGGALVRRVSHTQQCITRPKPHWLESTLFRHGFFANAVSQMKTRFHMSISFRWRHAETSRFLVCCTDRCSETARRRRFFRNTTSNTSGEPLRGESRRQSERRSILSLS